MEGVKVPNCRVRTSERRRVQSVGEKEGVEGCDWSDKDRKWVARSAAKLKPK
jgi:hypothetical protein